jgi:hypothetical protein
MAIQLWRMTCPKSVSIHGQGAHLRRTSLILAGAVACLLLASV